MSSDPSHIEVIGSGVVGLCCAKMFIDQGCHVDMYAASNGIDEHCCSWWAGGMLAPWCEGESAEPLITRLGLEGLAFWQTQDVSMINKGTLVIAQQRDQSDLLQFKQRSSCHSQVNAEQINTLEPDLAGRFSTGLHFEQECHLNPRKALQTLLDALLSNQRFTAHFGQALDQATLSQPTQAGWRIDCRGLSARDQLDDLRGVKGEMLILELEEISLERPVRLLHPRHPIYVVPRENQQFMVGATMIENDDRTRTSARSVMELLSSAYALHPAFAEATVIEVGTDVRPAFIDNLPRIRRRGRTVYVNGLYRHGFLCSPALAKRCVAMTLQGQIDEEIVDEYSD